MITLEPSTSETSAHATIAGILKDQRVTILVVLRSNASATVGADVGTRIDGIDHRDAVWAKKDSFIPEAERKIWFPDGSSHVGVVLSSVSNNRRKDKEIAPNSSIRQIEDTLLAVEKSL